MKLSYSVVYIFLGFVLRHTFMCFDKHQPMKPKNGNNLESSRTVKKSSVNIKKLNWVEINYFSGLIAL